MAGSSDDVDHKPDRAQTHTNGHSSTDYRALKRWAPPTALLSSILLVGVFIMFWFDFSVTIGLPFSDTMFRTKRANNPIQNSLNCSNNLTDWAKMCKQNIYYPGTYETKESSSSSTECPEYFRWINGDLRPWKSTGISRETMERAEALADFRLVIVNGKAYVERYRKPFQTRDLFTLWGILQLLRLYPEKVPDLELMFRCGDVPVIKKSDFQAPSATLPPPMFQYCGKDDAFGILFPDWTFWGWAETNIRPWINTLEGILEGSNRTKWKDRAPYAYWRGNPQVGLHRMNLMTCNVSHLNDWNARLYVQDWKEETKNGFKNSKLEEQCNHRYKVYIEGRAWSVSQKYILACDSTALIVKPDFYDFFSRSLMPLEHYWPIRTTKLCRDIRFAVDWGNNYSDQAHAIGKASSKFMQEKLKMEYVYDYMLHTLTAYARLLKFKPRIPTGAVELCLESLACPLNGLWKEFMEESMVRSPRNAPPCALPTSYDASSLQAFFDRKNNITRQVEMWSHEYWHKLGRE